MGGYTNPRCACVDPNRGRQFFFLIGVLTGKTRGTQLSSGQSSCAGQSTAFRRSGPCVALDRKVSFYVERDDDGPWHDDGQGMGMSSGMPSMMGQMSGMPSMMPSMGMGMAMMPRCTMKMEKCTGGMKITCMCDDEMAAATFRTCAR